MHDALRQKLLRAGDEHASHIRNKNNYKMKLLFLFSIIILFLLDINVDALSISKRKQFGLKFKCLLKILLNRRVPYYYAENYPANGGMYTGCIIIRKEDTRFDGNGVFLLPSGEIFDGKWKKGKKESGIIIVDGERHPFVKVEDWR